MVVTDDNDNDTKDKYRWWPCQRVSTFAAENAGEEEEEEELEDDHATYLSHRNNKRQYKDIMLQMCLWLQVKKPWKRTKTTDFVQIFRIKR